MALIEKTDNDAYNYYNAYAKKIGFGIRKDTFEKSKKASREILSRTFVCDKAGEKRASTENASGLTINRRPETKVGCGAKMKIMLTSSKVWKVTKFISEHVHPLTSPNKVMHHHSHKQRHRSKHCISLIELLHEEGMKPSNIKKVLNVGYQGQDVEQVTTQQMIDHIRKARQSNIGCEYLNIIRHFQDRKESDPDFYFAMEVDHFGTLRSVFRADGRARASYLRLGDVVVFDTAYKTNQLSMPFAPFIGVNHHRQSTLFGCALLADEREETFEWLFSQWLKCMHGVAPKAIITDQDAQIKKAIKNILPNTQHHFCSWHIRKHIVEQKVKLKSQYGDEMPTYFNNWYSSRSISKYEDCWEVIKVKFNINEGEDSWLTRMCNLREHWVDAYLKDYFWAGMTTSQRSESINAFFDGFVNANTRLVEFVGQYDKAVASRRASESHEDFMTLNTVPAMSFSNPIEAQVGNIYARAILKMFQKELGDVMSLHREEVSKEELKILQQNDDSMERGSIIRLWALRGNFNEALDMVAGSNDLLSKLEQQISNFLAEAREEARLNMSQTLDSQVESHIDSNTHVLILKDGEEIMVRDPLGPVKPKGRPKNSTRTKSGLEESKRQKEVRQRKCGHCQQLGHYRTGCQLLKKQKR
ncbi:protein FAR1-RELATED SEQUENCE 5-like [Asparagus officinalis]|uniref:protein FAR1-RELATED SEQUENCE 5-like n=1 Tax=Asparagus officinalis TaxID=4686 RepID=UPI00098E780B|nr:protein FAR1-RELATED SEQUENCE 5-like [Asparagus officinalis]